MATVNISSTRDGAVARTQGECACSESLADRVFALVAMLGAVCGAVLGASLGMWAGGTSLGAWAGGLSVVLGTVGAVLGSLLAALFAEYVLLPSLCRNQTNTSDRTTGEATNSAE